MASYWQVEIALNGEFEGATDFCCDAFDSEVFPELGVSDNAVQPFGVVEDIRDIIAALLFERFECEGVVLEEQTFKELKRTGKSDVLKAFFSEMPDMDELERVIKENIEDELNLMMKLSQVEEKDWSEEWKKNWMPAKISERIVICPTWREYEPKSDEIVVNLDPGVAFGTGAHATTQLCVSAIEKYMPVGAEVADIGCGSGILAVCAIKLGAKFAVGVDNDEDVIPVAVENAELNNADTKTKFFAAVASDLLGQKYARKYDFVLANILHNVLNEIMGELKQLIKEDGKIALSGILDEKEHIVQAAIEREGLNVIERMENGQWVGLVVGNLVGNLVDNKGGITD